MVIECSSKHPFYCLNPPAVQPDCEDILFDRAELLFFLCGAA